MGAGEWRTIFLIFLIAAIITAAVGITESRRGLWGVALGCVVVALAILGLAPMK